MNRCCLFSTAVIATVVSTAIAQAPNPGGKPDQDNGGLQFEVATIKPNSSDSPMKPWPSISGGGRFNASNSSIKSLLAYAHQVSQYQISGPKWMESTKFDIAAKLPEGAKPDEARDMLRSLLESRFGVVTHRDQVEMNVYALTVAGKEPKVRSKESGGTFTPKFLDSKAKVTYLMNNATMAKWSDVLTEFLDRPVIDQTGLTGIYQFMLTYDASGDGADAPNIFAALQEQAGFKLVPKRAMVDRIIVDRIERTPTDN